MFKSIGVIFSLVAVASSGLVVPQPRIACNECVMEMHNIAAVISQFAGDIEVTEFNTQNILKYWKIFQEFLKVEYCPAAAAEDEHLTIERCSQDLADAYPIMLDMVIQHFFNDGALHICQVAGVCDVRSELLANHKQPRP